MGVKDNEKLARRVRSAAFLVAVGMVVGSLAGFLFTPPNHDDGFGAPIIIIIFSSSRSFIDLASDDELRVFFFF